MGNLFEKYNSLSSVIKAGLWFTICNFLQKGISFITIPIFTRIMSTNEYGMYSIYNSWYSILVVFATLHLSYYVFNKGLVKYEDDKEGFIVSLQSLSASITVLFILLYFCFRSPINTLLRMPSSMVLFMIVQILFEPPILYWTARKRFDYEYKSVLLVTILIAFLNPALGILAIKLNVFGDAAIARVFSIALVSLVFGCFFALLLIKNGHQWFSTKYWKYALAFNLPLIPHYLSTTILSSSDRIMIGDMIGNEEAGIYSIAYSIGMVCTLFSQAIQQAFLPWLYKKMKVNDYSHIPETTNSFLIILSVILIIVICFAPEFVLIVGSRRYLEAMWSIPPICASVLFIYIQNLFSNIEYYFEKTRIIAVASVCVATVNVVLNYLFLPRFGYIAAGYTTLVSYALYALAHYYIANRICNLNNLKMDYLINIKFVLCISILMIIVSVLLLEIYSYAIVRFILIGLFVLLGVIMKKRIIALYRSVFSNKAKGDLYE